MGERDDRIETLKTREDEAKAGLGRVEKESDAARHGSLDPGQAHDAIGSERSDLQEQIARAEGERRELEAGRKADEERKNRAASDGPEAAAAPHNAQVQSSPGQTPEQVPGPALESNSSSGAQSATPDPAQQANPDSERRPDPGAAPSPRNRADSKEENPNKGFGPFEGAPLPGDGFDAADVNRNPKEFAGLPNAEMGNFPGEWRRKQDEPFLKRVEDPPAIPDGFMKPIPDTPPREDWEKIATEKALHQRQLGEMNDMKHQIVGQVEAAKKEMHGLDLNAKQQHEFKMNEFNGAFEQSNRLFASQDRETAALHASNAADHPAVHDAQMQNRAAMEQEMHAYRWGMTRELAAAQATEIVAYGNANMMQDYRSRMEQNQTPPAEMQAKAEALNRLQGDQFASDVYSKTNEVQRQQAPEIASQLPGVDAPGVTAGTPPGMTVPALASPQHNGPNL